MRHREMMDGKGIPAPEVPAYMEDDGEDEDYEGSEEEL